MLERSTNYVKIEWEEARRKEREEYERAYAIFLKEQEKLMIEERIKVVGETLRVYILWNM